MAARLDYDELARCEAAALLCVTGRAAAARRNAGFTMKQVGAILGVTESTISNWENQKYTPSLRSALEWLPVVEMMESVAERRRSSTESADNSANFSSV